jgi:hypothetical protein
MPHGDGGSGPGLARYHLGEDLAYSGEARVDRSLDWHGAMLTE